ncbi:SGNH/GDSL hydrolase family protein [Oculatella sp. FACHB-28]|uniref:SGNH/GDSL hydrolase family protein n=1 Tax=Oculatella sp. FACHB-28 TaxID=2692845 RepID=UPI0016862AFF|nr:SGNH/GDSL hydrolase family protein [Oculatella sp. FACHB-28]MBD2059186.1 SGNH/GDSL hydrolase family protein [Oculatella sp. FACHB-28]
MKVALIVVAVIVGLVLLTEVGLRILFGFGNPLIYIADEQIGYLLAPNQKVRRFGNRITINQYSMRSPEVTTSRPQTTLRLLLLGDSVANGGWWTDQNETISAMLQQQLQPSLNQTEFEQLEVLNASANSWSPRNELAYLRRFSSFEAQVVILLINTDDLFGTAPTSLPVGRDRNYPDHKPPFALSELVNRYLIKQQPIPGMDEVMSEGGDRVGFNLEAIQQINELVSQSNGRLILAMTPLLREIGTPGSRDYEIKARQRLKDFTEETQILYLDFLPIFNNVESPKALYRDHIHLSPQGNQVVSENLLKVLQDIQAGK